MSQDYKHVNNLWNDSEAAKLTGVDRLVYRSNKLGSDQRGGLHEAFLR
jgi:rhamnose utilization protein RhaD (predicted bifunctional aldolase and dehydrogenase)